MSNQLVPRSQVNQFGAKSTPVPNVNAQTRTGYTYVGDYRFWDTLNFGSGQILQSQNQAFRDGTRTQNPWLCNVPSPGQLISNQMFACRRIAVHYRFRDVGPDPAPVGPLAEELADLITHYTWIEFKKDNSLVFSSHSADLPQTGAVVGPAAVATTEAATTIRVEKYANGAVSCVDLNLRSPILIPPNTLFQINLNFGSGVVGTQADPLTAYNSSNAIKLLRIIMYGQIAMNAVPR